MPEGAIALVLCERLDPRASLGCRTYLTVITDSNVAPADPPVAEKGGNAP
jgi:hypothetical protein